MQREVDFHPNILRFYGISKLETGQMNKYLLVLEHADSGSLYSYLKENFNKLEWSDKYRLALQLASAVECIHNEGIIHCDLVICQFVNNLFHLFAFMFIFYSNLLYLIIVACTQCSCSSG